MFHGMDVQHPLKKVLQLSHRIRKQAPSIPPRTPTQRPRLSLSLPDVFPITDYLIRSGWKHSVAEYLSDIYTQNAKQLKLVYEEHMNDAVNTSLAVAPHADIPQNIPRIHAAYVKIYRDALAKMMELAKQRIMQSTTQRASGVSDNQGPFKQTAVFILEKAFLDNPYPDAGQKQTIASLTGMGYKQVHVWFQNKRSRSRREGKEVRRAAFVIKSGDDPRVMCDRISRFNSSSLPASRKSQLTRPDTQSTPVSCSFHNDRPPHAFPNIFSPISDYTPFPVLVGKQAFDTPWLRHTAVERCGSNANDAPIDIDQLCSPLSCLVLTDEQSPAKASSSKASRWTRRLRDHVAACFPVLIRPPTAPLPALVPATVTVHATTTTRSSASPSLSKHTIRVATSSATSTRQPSTRKSANALPQRVPQSLQKLARDSMHPYQSGKSSRPKAQQARLSRFSSVSSISSLASDNSCSSRASSASLDSPPPSTPPSLPAVLSQSVKVSAPDLIFSPSQDLDRLFGNTDPSRRSLLAHPPQVQVVQ
ncbi:hypothetical protein BDY19DRAFT_1044219 [Irpex rosettiformis]|uniref:Uncharacterized protein n=1 Tax=Irpex rosettiformis TaxID=378272 RepID=A0ACB8UJA3_9APHY|nr:hypothetical protein BDY19DRAFT_1044219 [Irpex rosettiformis]